MEQAGGAFSAVSITLRQSVEAVAEFHKLAMM